MFDFVQVNVHTVIAEEEKKFVPRKSARTSIALSRTDGPAIAATDAQVCETRSAFKANNEYIQEKNVGNFKRCIAFRLTRRRCINGHFSFEKLYRSSCFHSSSCFCKF